MRGRVRERHSRVSSRVVAIATALASGLILAAAAAHGHEAQGSDRAVIELPCATCQQHSQSRAVLAPLSPLAAQAATPSLRLPALVLRAPSEGPRFAWPARGPPTV